MIADRIELWGFSPVRWLYLEQNLPKRVGDINVYLWTPDVKNVHVLEQCILTANGWKKPYIAISNTPFAMTNEKQAEDFYKKYPCVLMVALPLWHDLATETAHRYSKELWLIRDSNKDFQVFAKQLTKWLELNYGTM